ncbi:S41 family peptidase [Xanthovirga aplysinae]|uniref:S41 family peptidase n=1 Tax=Xanthovirga aplysinae TaxID=2529853 RepID=UPI0012BBB342|nr:S41 family peptidase [Xanthovirga aplysinae]MTI30094.1 hypothetical protein [Xanthovirga aplysinae]
MNKGKLLGSAVVLVIIFFVVISKDQTEEKYVTHVEAFAGIDAISKLLSERSPYFDINRDQVISKIDMVTEELGAKETIEVDEFLNGVKQIFSELGDRHASIKKLESELKTEKYYLPFALAPWQRDKVIALRQNPNLEYSLYLEKFPFLSKIQGENIIEFISRHDILNKYAPSQTRLSLGVEKMNEFYQVDDGFKIGDSVSLKFMSANEESDTLISVKLVNSKTKWREINKYVFQSKKTKEPYDYLRHTYGDGIEYLRLNQMFDKSKDNLFFQWLTEYMNSIRNSNALIIDIRHNSGGSRDLIDFFSNYFIKPNDFFVANYAKYKGKVTNTIKESLIKRSLYPFDHFIDDNTQRLVLEKFSSGLKNIKISKDKGYSDYYYMMLKNNNHFVDYYYFDKPVYLIINEHTFSAASVFASSFKGLSNIVLVGVCSDSSSGLAKSYEVSGLRLRFSHMLSFQKDGNLFDGKGTEPDIEINRSLNHIFGIEDHQLNMLLTKIDKQKIVPPPKAQN